MARTHYVKKAQQRYEMVPTLDDDGNPKVVPRLRKDGTPKTTKKGKEITVRLTHADKSKPKPNLTCGKCGKEIEPGMPYKWVQPKSSVYGGSKRYRCDTCPGWRQSELTSSKMAGVYSAQEQLDDQLGSCESVDDFMALRDDLADQIESVGEEYKEAAQNIVDGFGHETMQSDELEEKGDSLIEWAEEIRNVDFDEEPDEPDEEPDEDSDEDERETWLSEMQDRLSDALAECPV